MPRITLLRSQRIADLRWAIAPHVPVTLIPPLLGWIAVVGYPKFARWIHLATLL